MFAESLISKKMLRERERGRVSKLKVFILLAKETYVTR